MPGFEADRIACRTEVMLLSLVALSDLMSPSEKTQVKTPYTWSMIQSCRAHLCTLGRHQ